MSQPAAPDSGALDPRRLAWGSGPVLSVGIDLAEVPRFRVVLARRPGLAQRVFTEA